MARCFRNLGYYFTEKALWNEAIACYYMSLQFDHQSKQAMSELFYIQQKTGKAIELPAQETINDLCQKYGFPSGADPDVLNFSYTYGKYFAEAGDTDGAKYCWRITYQLTNDEDILKMIEAL